MNIKEAKEQIKNSVTAYLQKDEFGEYIIPIVRQRPIFLIGAPGIGKTAIMRQISKELGICLVTYSMTHHTRQSALGLPFITRKNFGGKEYDVSEYTMSEIIASVYEQMEKTGIKEGLLFLDEINCVSETLSPAMLQFLQYKIFGRHAVPDGWVVVTAGNTPEYNNSVREFDSVTLDRLKKIDVEPDYNAWKEYAYKNGIHNSIITYLDIKKGDLFNIEATAEGKNIATPRGWEDLSEMIYIYEKIDITVDENLIVQYLQNRKIARDFALYYDLYNKYKIDFHIGSILSGDADIDVKEKAKKAKFEERLSLISLLLESTASEAKHCIEAENLTLSLFEILSDIKLKIKEDEYYTKSLLEVYIKQTNEELEKEKLLGNLKLEGKKKLYAIVNKLIAYEEALNAKKSANNEEAFEIIKELFNRDVEEMKKDIETAKLHFDNMFDFVKECFGSGHEMLMLVTEITMNYYAFTFVNKFGCKKYFENNKDILLYRKQKEIIAKMEKLNV
ncbi:MAG: ATP-binding protein [Clostridiaceae bacterium]